MNRKIDIVLAIATKDIVDSIKNRALLSVFIGVSFLLLANLTLPLLLDLAIDPVLVIYDEGQSLVIKNLKKSDVNKIVVNAEEAFVRSLSDSLALTIGVVIPVDFDDMIASTNQLTLEAYYMSWESKNNLQKMVFLFEDQLTQTLGKELVLHTDGNRLFPPTSSGGKAATRAMSLVFVIVVFSMVTVPFLIQDEREKKTLDVILVSPATFWQVILGKTIAGMAFGSVAAALMLLYNHAFIQQWGLAVVSTMVGILFAVAIGMLLGVLFENAQNTSILSGLILTILILPAVLSMTGMEFPAWVLTAFSIIPTDNLAQNFLISFGDQWIWPDIIKNLGLLAGFSLVFITLAVWRIRKTAA